MKPRRTSGHGSPMMKILAGAACAAGLAAPAAWAQEDDVPLPAFVSVKACVMDQVGGNQCLPHFSRRAATIGPRVRVRARVWCFAGAPLVTVKLRVGTEVAESAACGVDDDGGPERVQLETAGLFFISAGPNVVRRFPVKLSVGGKAVRRGVLAVGRTAFVPGFSRRIYSLRNFDEYFNVCVRGGYEVYASGGDVYCTFERAATSRFRTSVTLD